MDTLWASWRSTYVRTADELNEISRCLFCRLPDVEAIEDSLVLERGEGAFTVLNRFPYTTGHLMVSPYRHIADLSEATAAEAGEMWRLLVRAERAVRAAMGPHGFNLGANLGKVAGAGVPGHLHLHLVPRWEGDTNFMTAVGGTRVVPEDLMSTYERISSALSGIGIDQ